MSVISGSRFVAADRAAAALPLDGHWLQRLRAQADRPPLRPRVPLLWQVHAIGSIEPALAAHAGLQRDLPAGLLAAGEGGWYVQATDLDTALAQIAQALKTVGLTQGWRDELLPVCDAQGHALGRVERAAVRPLGIATRAVHLMGITPDGRHWVQQRALDKANDPGMWDTLMGGMVPAGESLEQALARETWEEAGLHLPQLAGLEHGGWVQLRKPSGEGGPGYTVERIDWWRCTVPAAVQPLNQDGEVQQFQVLTATELALRLHAGAFTLEAGVLLADAWGAEVSGG